MKEVALLSVRQHIIKYFFRLPRWFVGAFLMGFVFSFFTLPRLVVISIVLAIIGMGLLLEWRRYARSKLTITNLRVYLSVTKWIAGEFEAGMHYHQIKNCSFRKEHVVHTFTDSGTLYLRAWPTEGEQIAAWYVPNVEKVCHVVNWMLALPEEDRKELQMLPAAAKQTV